jgi:cystathionine gamma-synthase
VSNNWTPRTRAIASARPEAEGEPVNVPITPASTLGLAYAREDGTQTWAALEQAIGELEGGSATAFASGIAAASAIFDLLPVGARVVVPTFSYAGTRALLEHGGSTGRIRVEQIDPDDTDGWVAATETADVLFLESPTNPTLDLMDIAAIARAAAGRQQRPMVVVDNTFATPLGQQPLALGADVVMHSATKFIGGHSDLLLGLTVARDGELAKRLRDARTRNGATPGALEAWLALRGLRTLPVRLAESTRNAELLADRLDKHPAVTRVRYPGTGAMLAFDLADAETADRFCAKLTLIRHATSLGGVESTLERRARMAGDSHVPAGLIRFSVGLEDPDDLWLDLSQALDA